MSRHAPQVADLLSSGSRQQPAANPLRKPQMKAVITARLRRLQRLPHILRGFFGDPELAYITAVA